MKAYQSTAAQASFANSLAQQVGDDAFAEAFEKAARINMNRPWGREVESRIKAVRRLSKKAASQLISDLIVVRDAA